MSVYLENTIKSISWPQNQITPTPPPLDWQQRPVEIQHKIDQAFNRLIDPKNHNEWKFDGKDTYKLCAINEHQLIKTIVETAPPGQQDFYILDIGAGRGYWGQALGGFILANNIGTEKKFHIISLTGEKRGGDIFEQNQVKLYDFGEVRIEELSSELKKRGIPSENCMDLIVSRWCFRHLVDPVGTFCQAYNSLRAGTRLIFMDGFTFKIENSDIEDHDQKMAQLLLDAEVPFLMKHYNDEGSFNQFLVKRANQEECHLPMSYVGIEASNTKQVTSGYVTRFHRERPKLDPRQFNLLNDFYTYQGDRDLYDWFEQHDLFDKKYAPDPRWFMVYDDTDSFVEKKRISGTQWAPILK